MEFILTYQLYPFTFSDDAFSCGGGGGSRIGLSVNDLDENSLSLYLLVIFSLDILSHRS